MSTLGLRFDVDCHGQMTKFLQRLGAAVYRFRVLVIVFWVAVLIGMSSLAGTVSGKMSNDFEIRGQESTDALAILAKRTGSDNDGGATAKVVFHTRAGSRVTAGENRSSIEQTLKQLRSVTGAVEVSDPLDPKTPAVSKDGRVAYSSISFSRSVLELNPKTQTQLLAAVHDAATSSMAVDANGPASIDTQSGGGAGELIGVGVALVVLLITFGALLVAGMNILTALIGVGIGLTGITAATGFIELQSTAPTLATMLGLAVGVDYALFIVSRFRSELRAGHPVPTAISTTVATAGSAVIVAGLTVVIALAGLAVVRIPFLTQMGLAGASTVVIAVLVAITLTPAALSLLGRRALPRRERKAYLATQDRRGLAGTGGSRELDIPRRPRRRGLYGRWIDGVTARPGLTLAATAAILILASVPLLSLRMSLVSNAAPGTTQARADKALAAGFGAGSQSPITVLLDGGPAVKAGSTLKKQFSDLDNVATVTPPAPTQRGTAALITVVPNHATTDDRTVQLVHDLRSTIKDVAPGGHGYVTGEAAVNIDVAHSLNRALPVYLALIVGLAFMLLVLVFRSLLAPLIGVLGFILTIGATLGATTAVFQWGWLSNLFGLKTTGPLISLTPILVVGILFGLAMDYQIFLVSRMHEAHGHGEEPVAAIRVGFRMAAPVVAAAAVIMFAIFAGFFPGGDATLKAISFSLGTGIAIDAVVVRMMLVPAAMALVGESAWALPGWLQWLPHPDIEGAAVTGAVATEAAPEARHDAVASYSDHGS